MALSERPYSKALIAVDAAAFAIFAFQRNDGLGFWLLPGPWADVFRFNVPGATIALAIYVGGSILALIGGSRGLRLVEAISLIATPFLFNLLVILAADWHMAEIGAFVTAHAALPFPAQAAIGRALTLFFLGESMLTLICFISVDRPPLSRRLHAIYAVSAIFAAVTPLIANAAQLVPQPVLAIVFSSACAALAQGGLWAIVYLMTGVRARLARRPAAAVRRRLEPLAHRLHQGRDLRRAVHRLHSDRRDDPATAGSRRRSSPATRSSPDRCLAHSSFRSARRSWAAPTERLRSLAGSKPRTATRERRCGASSPDWASHSPIDADLACLRGRRAVSCNVRPSAPCVTAGSISPSTLGASRPASGQAANLASLCFGPVARGRRGRRARMVLRLRPAPGRHRQVLGLCGRRLSARRPGARRFHHLSHLQQVRHG